MLLIHTEFSSNTTITYTEGKDCPLFCSEFCQDLLPISHHQPQHGSWCLSHHQDHLGPSASVAVVFPVVPLGSSVRATSSHLLCSRLVRFHPEMMFFFINLFCILFNHFWLHWVFVAARGLPLVAASGGYSSLRCAGFSLRWLLLLRSTGSRYMEFSSCGTQAQ